MKRTVFAFASSVVLAGTFALAQTPTPRDPQSPASPPSVTQPAPQPAPQSQKVPDTRLTGCLIQGSSPSVFILDNARMSADAKTGEGKKYVVVMADAAGLRNQVNRQVTITGTADEKAGALTAQPVLSGAEERDLPRFSAKAIVRVADVCTTT